MKNKQKTIKVLLIILLIALSPFMLVPFYWMVIPSLKMNRDVFSVPMKQLPDTNNIQWKNYNIIWKKILLLVFFKSTVRLAIITTIIQLCISCFAAYGFIKTKFAGRNLIFSMYATTIVISQQVHMVPQLILTSKVGLNDTHLGPILMQALSAFGMLLIRQFYISTPNELCEAARIDELNEYSIFVKIVFPLGEPAMATLTIFIFTNVRNDFMGSLIYLKIKELKTIQLGTRMFISQYGADYAWTMAASVCSLVLVVIVFLSCQKFFVEDAATGGIKG